VNEPQVLCLSVVVRRGNQALGIYGLRRHGEKTKTPEIKAAATGANGALAEGLFKLCGFIFLLCFGIFNRVQKTAFNLIYARKSLN